MRYFNDQFHPPLKLDLGCGAFKREGYLGIDGRQSESQWHAHQASIDVEWDLSKGIPFQDTSVAAIYTSHFLEHVNIDFMLKEIHRVALPGAEVHIVVPYANSAEGMTPGHVNFLTEKFFDGNTTFQEHFQDVEYRFDPTKEWETGELQRQLGVPFDAARKFMFNVCAQMHILCKPRKPMTAMKDHEPESLKDQEPESPKDLKPESLSHKRDSLKDRKPERLADADLAAAPDVRGHDGSGTPRRTLVAVLSLSRSGSSLISRVLHELLGIDFGEPIEHIPANRNNVDGYFENAEILATNEAILAEFGASIFEPPPVDYYLRAPEDSVRQSARRIQEVVAFCAENRPRFGFKDPRLALTFPFWKRAFTGIVPVIIFRSPAAAAQSITDQAGIPLERATALWYEYYHRIFRYTAGMPRYVISFERLLESPVEVVTGLAEHLGMEQDAANLAFRLRTIVRPEMVRDSGRVEPVELSPYIDAKTKIVYAYLDRLSRDFAQPDYTYLGAVMTGLFAFDDAAARKGASLREDLERSRNELALREKEALEADEAAPHVRAIQEDYRIATDRVREEAQREHARMTAHFADAAREQALEVARATSDRLFVQQRLAVAREGAIGIADQLERLRDGRFQRLRRFLLGDTDLWDEVSPTFSQFKEDARTFGARGLGYVLQVGPDLRAVPYLEYPFRLRKGRLAGLMLAPVADVPECGGQIGVEIVDPGDHIVAHVQAALVEVRIHAPLRFGFAPFDADGRPGWRLRVFLRESPSPARVFEFQALRGRWNPRRLPFCRRVFQD